MKITKIEIQKNNKQRVNLFLDDEFSCGLSVETILRFRLKEGQEINGIELENLKSQTEREVALNKATNYISKSQKSQEEVKKYLKKKGFEDDIIEFVINKLLDYHFVDDNDYAKNYIKSKTSKNGKIKLKFCLKQKGVSEEIINNCIEEYSKDTISVYDVANKYLKNKELNKETKQKAYRYLSSRGYSSEDILSCLNKIFKGCEENENGY